VLHLLLLCCLPGLHLLQALELQQQLRMYLQQGLCL
jgi:hypothetical protein